MRKGHYEIEFSGHATFRIENRSLPWDVVKNVIQNGSFQRFGKNMVNIKKVCGRDEVTCVGQIKEDRIRIITVTVRRKKP